jgi:hypothetical protein
MLLRAALAVSLRQGPAAAEAWLELESARLTARGRAPAGVFATVEQAHRLETLAKWRRALGDHLDPDGRLALGAVHLGRAAADAEAPRIAPAISLEVTCAGERVAVEIHGTTGLVVGKPAGSLLLEAGDPAKERIEVKALRAFVDHVALSASGLSEDDHAALLCFAGVKQPPTLKVRPFAPMGRERARAYLAELSSELLTGVHDYFLPCEAALGILAKPGDAAGILARRREDVAHTQSRFGPVRHPERARLLDADEALSICRRRYAPFLAGADQPALPLPEETEA